VLEGKLAQAFDLADIYHRLAREGRLAGYELHQRFYEIGSPAGLRETDQYLRERQQQ
jgi:N-acetyl-alpha-D-muramate 1-phosphate uridylyltransferase